MVEPCFESHKFLNNQPLFIKPCVILFSLNCVLFYFHEIISSKVLQRNFFSLLAVTFNNICSSSFTSGNSITSSHSALSSVNGGCSVLVTCLLVWGLGPTTIKDCFVITDCHFIQCYGQLLPTLNQSFQPTTVWNIDFYFCRASRT